MKNTLTAWFIALLWFMALLVSAIVAGCGKTDISGPSGDISMTTPYVTSSDIASIDRVFSSGTSAPWGVAHNGIDFSPNGDWKPFQAVSSGVVDDVRLWRNDITSTWQVNVRIRFNSTYSVEYAFEPFSTVQSDGQVQLGNILVSVGQSLSQGDTIGRLYTAGSSAHVHFTLMKNWVAICPEPYFTGQAKDSILDLIHKDHPTWNMCY